VGYPNWWEADPWPIIVDVGDTLTVGISNETRHTVTKDMSPPHLPVIVLSTPAMIGLIEVCCLAAAARHIDDGETTVGTHVCVSHDAAVNEGEEFEIRCRLASIEKRRLNFDVQVDGPRGPVSRGTHQRAVVGLSRLGGH
jgi:fluoroacetyl-CoA thioesterase